MNPCLISITKNQERLPKKISGKLADAANVHPYEFFNRIQRIGRRRWHSLLFAGLRENTMVLQRYRNWDDNCNFDWTYRTIWQLENILDVTT